MAGLETLTEAINRLSKSGYAANLRALGGSILVTKTNQQTKPEDYDIDEIVRFEGDTNLDDESVLFALRHRTLNIKGLYVAAFGPQMDLADLDVVLKLNRQKQG